MKSSTALKIAQGIQLHHLANNFNYTQKELSRVSGVGISTIKKEFDLIIILDFAITTMDKRS